MSGPFEVELALRIADAAEILDGIPLDEDGESPVGDMVHWLAILDRALHGDPGCQERPEFHERRRQALAKYGADLGLGELA